MVLAGVTVFVGLVLPVFTGFTVEVDLVGVAVTLGVGTASGFTGLSLTITSHKAQTSCHLIFNSQSDG